VSQPPSVIISSFDVNAPAARFHFNEDVGASVDLTDVTVLNTATNQAVPRDAIAIAYDLASRELSYRFTQPLADGRYRATLRGVGIVDNQSNVMLADRVIDFHVLAGDANQDGVVNLADFNILASNFGQSNRTFTQGDFNYDGTVNLADFNLLASRFGQSVAPMTATSARDDDSTSSTEENVFDDLLA
jgi:hypothetical protein